MKTAGDIEKLRKAEEEAQGVLAASNQRMQDLRAETEASIKRLEGELDAELDERRRRGEEQAAKDADSLRIETRDQIARGRQTVAQRLEAGRAAAVSLVVKELTGA